MLRRVQQLGRNLLRTNSLGCALLFIAIGDSDRRTSQLLPLLLEIGASEHAHGSLNPPQRDPLAEDIYTYDFFLAELSRYDLAFLGKALAALDIEFVFVPQAAHQASASSGDLRRIQR